MFKTQLSFVNCSDDLFSDRSDLLCNEVAAYHLRIRNERQLVYHHLQAPRKYPYLWPGHSVPRRHVADRSRKNQVWPIASLLAVASRREILKVCPTHRAKTVTDHAIHRRDLTCRIRFPCCRHREEVMVKLIQRGLVSRPERERIQSLCKIQSDDSACLM